MKRKAFYAEKSLIDRQTFFETSAKDNNRLSREGAAIYASWSFPVSNDRNVGVIAINKEVHAEPGCFGINYKALASTFEILEERDDIEIIVLDINSPGGEVSGLFDLCEAIRNCTKPVYAYTSGNLASAAYTIAAATNGIYANESANIGSVGVFMSFYDDRGYLKKHGIREIEFYGKNSDKKNLDPESNEGKEVYQAEINEIEEILIKNIANYRGVTSEYVLNNFGHGLMFRGREALERGMIDGIVSDFEEFINTITAGETTANGGTGMAGKDNNVVLATSVEQIEPDLLAKIQSEAIAGARSELEAQTTEKIQEAVAAERKRVAELDKFASLPNTDIAAMAEKAKTDGTSVDEFMGKFNAMAFEILSTSAKSIDTNGALAKEASDSALIDTGSQKSKGVQEKSNLDRGNELAQGLIAKMKK